MTSSRARGGALALMVAAGLLLTVAAALPASAHNVLRSSDPADGAVVPAPPPAIGLVFDDSVITLGTEVAVDGPAGPLGLEPLLVEGATVTQPLPEQLPAGTYTVTWRATSADGHPISGELAFSADAPSASPPSATGGTAPGPTAPGEAAEDENTSDAASPNAGNGLPGVAWVAVGGGVLAAAGGATLALKGRRPPPSQGEAS